MGNHLTSNLPADIDEQLMGIAQSLSCEVDGKRYEIDYSDIIDFSEQASKEDILNLRSYIADLVEYGFDIESDDTALIAFKSIVNLIKGTKHA